MKELNTSSTDAMHWAECLAERINSGTAVDAGFLVGWFANYWAAVHDPIASNLEAAEAENEANERNLNILTTAVGNADREIEALRARVKELEEALRLADEALAGSNMNMKKVEKKVKAAIAAAQENNK